VTLISAGGFSLGAGYLTSTPLFTSASYIEDAIFTGSNLGDTIPIGDTETAHGGSGDDTFVVNGNAGGLVDGGGGFDTLDVATAFSASTNFYYSDLTGLQLNSIERIEFSANTGYLDQILLSLGANISGLSSDLAVVGNDQVDNFNLIGHDGGTFNFSGWNFSNWANPQDFVDFFAYGSNAYNITGPNYRSEFVGGDGDDIFRGGSANDVMVGGPGNDVLDGGAGRDVVLYSYGSYQVASTAATLTHNADGSWTVNAGVGDVDTLINDEAISFSDRTLSLTALNPETHDFTGSGQSDFLIENTSGIVVLGAVSSGQASYSQVGGLGPEWTFHGTGNFLNDGKASFLIENLNGAVDVGELANGQAAYTQVGGLGHEWSFVGAGNFLAKGYDQFLIENTDGVVVVGDVASGQAQYTQVAGLGHEWTFVGAGDFLGDVRAQFLIENTDGAIVLGEVGANNQTTYTQIGALGPEWSFVGSGNFLGGGEWDFLIENTSGIVVMGAVGANSQAVYTPIAALGHEWTFEGTGDFLHNGHDQFMIENLNGAVVVGDYVAGAIQYTQISGLGSEWSFHA
jgi:hypothetical protein